MKKYGRLPLAALITAVLSLALLLAGCRGENREEAAEGGSGSPAPEQETIGADRPLSCTIVRGDASDKAVTDAAVALRKLLQEAGLEADIKTDWVKRGEEITRFPNEILIGPTNRPESEELYEKLNGAEVPYDYLITVGTVNRIAAPDDTIGEAAAVFAREYAAWVSARIRGEEQYEVKDMEKVHQFPGAGMTLFGLDLSGWAMVYPEEYTTEQRADMEALADWFYRASGVRVPASTERGGSPHAILVGTASPLTPKSPDLSYLVRWDGEDLHIGGSSYWADCRALYRELIYGALGSDYDLTVPEHPPVSVALQDMEEGDPSLNRFFSVSGWCTSGDSYDTEALVRQTAEAGFTKISVAGIRDPQLCRNMMKWCAIWDLEILWTGVGWDSFSADVFRSVESAMDAPHVWGLYLCDEPNSSAFPALAGCVETMGALTDQTAFINLFPMYANQTQLGNPTYREHVEQFFDTVHPRWASVDIYPCNTSGLYDGYMENLAIVADACRRRDVPFSVYLQSVSFAASKRTPSEADLEWQTWCIRSFGASEAIYFTYMTPYSTAEDFKPALIDHDLQPTARWYAAQKINGEFAALDEAFSRYPKNLGVFSVNAKTNPKKNAFMRFGGQLDFSEVIREIDSASPLLFGCFTDGREGYAFTVVNCEDLQKDIPAEVRLKTEAPLTVWQNGGSSRLDPDAEGFVSLHLDSGEGVFCEVIR